MEDFAKGLDHSRSNMECLVLHNTTTKVIFYDTCSKTVVNNRLRIRSGGNFVINKITFVFNVAHSKAVVDDRLRMSFGGNIVITWNQDKDGFY